MSERKMQDQLKVTFLGAVALNLAVVVVVVAVSDTLLYFSATAQNHIQRVTKRLRVTCITGPAFSSPAFSSLVVTTAL